MKSEVFLMDCMEGMKGYPDKYFNLSIVDPMFGLDEWHLTPGQDVSNGIKRKFVQDAKKLSKLPIVNNDYYEELVRVSQHQIIWGINYFEFAGRVPGRIVWDKKNDDSTFSNCELAACSLIQGVRIFRYLWNGMLQQNMKNKETRIHPFQKPIALYEWQLQKFAKPGWKLLSTHVGSGSDRIAAYSMGFDFVGFEIDETHFRNMEKRFKQFKSQTKLFAWESLR